MNRDQINAVEWAARFAGWKADEYRSSDHPKKRSWVRFWLKRQRNLDEAAAQIRGEHR